MFQTGITDCFLEGFQFLPVPFGSQFHATVEQIPNRPGNFKTCCY